MYAEPATVTPLHRSPTTLPSLVDSAEPFAGVQDCTRLTHAWAALLIYRQIVRARLLGLLPPVAAPGSSLTGAYISDDQAESATRSLQREATAAAEPLPEALARATLAAAETGALLHQRLAASARAGRRLPILVLGERFGLDQQERDLVLLLCAAAAEARVGRLLAYLQDDLRKTHPDAAVALSLLAPLPDGEDLPWRLLDPQGPLRFYQLITLDLPGSEPLAAPLEGPLFAAPAVAAYVAHGQLWLDDETARCARLLVPQQSWDQLCWAPADKTRLRRSLEMAAQRARRTRSAAGALLRGAAGTGKKAALLAFCQGSLSGLLVIDAERLPADEGAALRALRGAVRDARLHQALIYVERCDGLGRDGAGGAARLRAVTAAYRHCETLMFFGAEQEQRLDLEDALGLPSLEMPRLGPAERAQMWRAVLPPALDPAGDKGAWLAACFPLHPGDIAPVGPDIEAHRLAGGSELDHQGLCRLVLARSRHNLRAIASPVHTPHTLEDVVLPPDILQRCQRIITLVDAHGTLSERWGLGRKVMTHRGVSALFSGPPGTGKTMMAALIGDALGLDVYRIDLSRVLSKWVGETEKNLARVFDEAARTRAVLVFDEADSLFGRRTEVRSASDRYSNVEVNYLLQRLESFEGVVILTTNLESGIDEAFVRRLNFKIRFPAPEHDERRELWRRLLPPEMSFDDDVDLDELAEQFAVTGGFIRNALIRAALIAMSEGATTPCLRRGDLLQAVAEEMEEAGRLA